MTKVTEGSVAATAPAMTFYKPGNDREGSRLVLTHVFAGSALSDMAGPAASTGT